ncbi:MAG TPA: hypothetical protein VFC79_11395 [Tissierellaceae bacterium]|nr:hypothetical protein [Tissierellaceae bacterium]
MANYIYNKYETLFTAEEKFVTSRDIFHSDGRYLGIGGAPKLAVNIVETGDYNKPFEYQDIGVGCVVWREGSTTVHKCHAIINAEKTRRSESGFWRRHPTQSRQIQVAHIFEIVSSVGPGQLISTVIGKENQYPLNGIYNEGDFYIRTDELSDIATLTSPTGGETITDLHLITFTKSNPNTTVDIELSCDNGATWKVIQYGVTQTTYAHDFIDEQETSRGRLRVRASAEYGTGKWDMSAGVFTIAHGNPPFQPSELTPTAGKPQDKTDVIRLSWMHNHINTQSKFDLRYSTNQINWTTITRSTSNQYHYAPEDLFTEGTIYWQVKTYSDIGIPSVWSNVAVFTAGTPSGLPIITSPTLSPYVRPIIQWTQGDQAKYQVQVLNSLNQTVWDTGQVTSINKALTTGIDLLNNATYTVKVRTQTELGLWTGYATQELLVLYTEPPIPEIYLIEGNYGIEVNISNPDPTGLQPEVAYHDIYRDGERIATQISNVYLDDTVASGVEYQYHVRAIATTGSMSQSEFHKLGITFENALISTFKGDFIMLEIKSDTTENNELLGGLLHFAGRKLPVMQFEEYKKNRITATYTLYKKDDLQKIEDIVNEKATILYRDDRGRKVYGVIRGLQTNDYIEANDWYEIAFTIEAVEYSEVV